MSGKMLKLKAFQLLKKFIGNLNKAKNLSLFVVKPKSVEVQHSLAEFSLVNFRLRRHPGEFGRNRMESEKEPEKVGRVDDTVFGGSVIWVD